MINNIEDNKESIVNFESNKKILFSESNDEDKNNILNKEKLIQKNNKDKIIDIKNIIKQEIESIGYEKTNHKSNPKYNKINKLIQKKKIEIENSKNNNRDSINNTKTNISKKISYIDESSNYNKFNKTINNKTIKTNTYNHIDFSEYNSLNNTNNNFNENNIMEKIYNNIRRIPDINLIGEKKPLDMILFDEKEYKRIKDKNFGTISTKRNKNIDFDNTSDKLWNIKSNKNIDNNNYINRVKEDVLKSNNLNLFNNCSLYNLNSTNYNNTSSNFLNNNNNYTLRYKKTSLFSNNSDNIMPVNFMRSPKNDLF